MTECRWANHGRTMFASSLLGYHDFDWLDDSLYLQAIAKPHQTTSRDLYIESSQFFVLCNIWLHVIQESNWRLLRASSEF